jgi:hypothetical protein
LRCLTQSHAFLAAALAGFLQLGLVLGPLLTSEIAVLALSLGEYATRILRELRGFSE